MSSHILTIFTAFDGGSLATPLSKDGFELTSIAKKLYKSRSISSKFDIMRYSCCKISNHDRCLYTNACRSKTDDTRGEFCAR